MSIINQAIAAVTQQRLWSEPVPRVTVARRPNFARRENRDPTARYIDTITLRGGLVDIQDRTLGGESQMRLWEYSDTCAGTKLSRG